MSEYSKILLGIEFGNLPAQSAVDWALEQLESGLEADRVTELAMLNKPSRTQAIETFRAAIEELQLPLPTNEAFQLCVARTIAKEILSGKVDPNVGCAQIAEINRELDWPAELSAFEALAHEQTGHSSIGITAESVLPEIFEEAKRLVGQT